MAIDEVEAQRRFGEREKAMDDMGELIELEYDGVFAQCPCGSDCWHILVDKPGDFTRLEGVICAGCGEMIKFEPTG